MPKLSNLSFVSSNENKYAEVRDILSGFELDVKFACHTLEEIQSDSLEEIAKRKADDAFEKICRPIIIEDDGLFINSLGGFPGPFSSYVFQTIGNDGILKLLGHDRQAKFISIISYRSEDVSKSFVAELEGSISCHPHGDGWGFDPIFIPAGKSCTFAEMHEKNNISHRFMALEKFSRWYQSMQKSSGL